MKYLVTGGNGQLAKAFIRRLGRASSEFIAPDSKALDITDARAVDSAVSSFRPDVILNCAAYNLVDMAETDRETAFRVNAEGPRILAEAAERFGALIVHFSTDYVFDGAKENGLYTEEDSPSPLSEYGKSKLAGERAVSEKTGRHLIFRLSWVFGEGRRNFIWKLAELAEKNEYLRIAYDEFSVPTYAENAAEIVLMALKQRLTGLYHLTNYGYCSRYEYAKLALEKMGVRKFIRPVSMNIFNLPAARPGFSAMSPERLMSALGAAMPRWEDAVEAFLTDKEISFR